MAEKFINIRETAEILGLTEKQVIDLSNEGKIPAYKIGGEFLRFRLDQIQVMRDRFRPEGAEPKPSFKEQLQDFFYFNDFYIVTLIVILTILLFIFRQ
ncbi:MAG: helix-turn-helix domain-containing protein, partial [Candidatus Omnitrophica bacterium]|nr:helix-turn-helix domain-containing protein [Candidatus Omnitrophota bacterium]